MKLQIVTEIDISPEADAQNGDDVICVHVDPSGPYVAVDPECTGVTRVPES